MSDVVFTLDRAHRHVEVFGTWLASEGLRADAFVGKTAAEILGPAAALPHQEANRRALAGEAVTYEWSTAAPDGERWFQTSLAPLYADDGSVEGLSGVAREVTASHRAHDALNASNAALARLTADQSRLIAELEDALGRVRHLSGLLPICSRCKKIRDDDGYWQDVAVYLRDHTEADFTHGICPDCCGALYGDLDQRLPPR